MRCPSRAAAGYREGSDRLSPTRNATTSSPRATSGPHQVPPGLAIAEFGAGALEIPVADRGAAAGQQVGVGDLRHHQLDAAARRSNSAKKGDASASGMDRRADRDEPHRTRGREGACPPPRVGCASRTWTFRVARAQTTAAASPLGPLPTTVTSIAPSLPRLPPSYWPGPRPLVCPA